MTTQFAEKLSVNKYAEEGDNTSGPLAGAAITAGHLFPSTLEAAQRRAGAPAPPIFTRCEREIPAPGPGRARREREEHLDAHTLTFITKVISTTPNGDPFPLGS